MPSPATDSFDRSQQGQTTVPQGFLFVLDERFQDEFESFAQAVAFMTHSLWTVEAEELRRWRLEADAAIRAGVVRTEELLRS